MTLLRNILVAAMASHVLLKRTYAQRVRNIGAGVGLMMISGALGLLGIIGGIFSIFFALANVSQFVYPALIAGGISLLLAIVIGIEGKKILKRL